MSLKRTDRPEEKSGRSAIERGRFLIECAEKAELFLDKRGKWSNGWPETCIPWGSLAHLRYARSSGPARRHRMAVTIAQPDDSVCRDIYLPKDSGTGFLVTHRSDKQFGSHRRSRSSTDDRTSHPQRAEKVGFAGRSLIAEPTQRLRSRERRYHGRRGPGIVELSRSVHGKRTDRIERGAHPVIFPSTVSPKNGNPSALTRYKRRFRVLISNRRRFAAAPSRVAVPLQRSDFSLSGRAKWSAKWPRETCWATGATDSSDTSSVALRG